MDGQQDQQPNIQPGQPVYAPPPLTPMADVPSQPVQQTPVSGYPGSSGYPLQQWSNSYGQPIPSLAVTPAPPKQPSGIGRPFPALLSIGIFVGSIVVLAAAFIARVAVFGGDWADGATTVGVVALILLGLSLIVVAFRTAAGRRGAAFALLSALLLLVYAGTGAASLITSPTLHAVQAKSLEQSGQYNDAIREYMLSGQTGSNAPDVARVQIAWGQQLLAQKDYTDALTHFQTVLDDYKDSGQAVVTQAQTGAFETYAAWMKDDSSHVPYADAIVVFANYGSNAACDSDCKTTLAQVAPQAYFLYGSQLLTQKKYTQAIAEFEKLTAQYGSSSYASQAHAKAATAYLAYGKQQISAQDCSGAVITYTTLTTNYKGTAEANQAQTALSAPQSVSGTLANPPTNPTPTMHLSKQMNFNAFYFSNEYATSVDAKTGKFTFKSVALGTYYISMSRPVPGAIDYTAWWADSSHKSYYAFKVTPLCPLNIGTLQGK